MNLKFFIMNNKITERKETIWKQQFNLFKD